MLQNEMKFIAFFAFVATVCATKTVVKVTPNVRCDGIQGSYPYDQCGSNPLPFYGGKTAALISDNKLGVVFYKNLDCTGEEYYEVKGPVPEEKCYNLKELLPFEPMCIYIICAKVSCHIVILIFSILMRLI